MNKRHREQSKNKRRKRPLLGRPEPALSKKPTLLIVCEGKNTEPSYFRQFRLSSASVKAIGEGYNTLSLVRRAAQLADQNHYEQVWCVFDKDDFADADFNAAIKEASTCGFRVAYSNQAFEYWLILHFDDHQGGGMHRDSYHRKINELLSPYRLTFDGKKGKTLSGEIFELLDGTDEKTGVERKQLAISRAKRNYGHFNHSNPAREESTTTVFHLVEELLKHR